MISDGKDDDVFVYVCLVLLVVEVYGEVVDIEVASDGGLAVRHSSSADEALVDVGGEGWIAVLCGDVVQAGKERLV